MEPQLDNAQVTRLLEIAAAMSSAQEKVTGSGKLDLSGVMAALAMANKQEGGRAGFGAKTNQSESEGRQSFLHGGWRSEEGKQVQMTRSNVSSEVSQQAVRSSEGLAQFLNGLKGENQRCSDDPPSRKPSPPPIENPLANQSFLHSIRQEGQKTFSSQESNKYNSYNNNNNNNSNNSNTSTNTMPMSNSGGVAGRKAIFEASSSSSSFSSSCSNSSSPDTGKRVFSLPSSSPPQQEKTFTPKNRRAGEQPEKTFTPPRVTPPPARNGAQSLVEEETGLSSRLADRKAKFETRTSGSVGGIKQQQATNIPVATVFERKGSKAEAKGQQVQKESKGEDDEGSLASLPQLLDSRDSQVAQFLEVVTAMAGERAKRTGDGRLDMGGLLEALAAVEGIQVQEKETKELGDKTQNGSLAAAGSKAQSSSWKPGVGLTDGRGRQQGLGGAAVEEGGEEVRQSWQEALRGARRPGGVRGQSEEAARSGGLRGHIEEAIRAGGVKEPDVTVGRRVGLSRGEGTVLAQPAMATLTPPPPPLPPRDSCPPPLASIRAPGQTSASSFPSLPSTAPPPTLQRPSQMKASQPFVEEKSSVIGELKNILEDGGSNGGTLGRSQGSSSGFKLPLPQEPMDTSNPQDPTVKRIVYNQYREMLKSYRTAQT